MLKTRDIYPINEGVSGYWDVLRPKDLAEFDTAMDYTQAYISASRSIRLNLGSEIDELVREQREALVHLNSFMPDPWIFDPSIPRLKYIGRTPDNTTSMYMNPRGSIIYGPTKQ